MQINAGDNVNTYQIFIFYFYHSLDVGGVFGLETVQKTSKPSANGLPTYLTTRVPGGSVRRESMQDGEYFVEVRVYTTEEATKAQPDQRWKLAQVTLKAKLDRGTDQWEALQNFMHKTHELFNESDPVFIAYKVV